jgi:hypothetical protein
LVLQGGAKQFKKKKKLKNCTKLTLNTNNYIQFKGCTSRKLNLFPYHLTPFKKGEKKENKTTPLPLETTQPPPLQATQETTP